MVNAQSEEFNSFIKYFLSESFLSFYEFHLIEIHKIYISKKKRWLSIWDSFNENIR